MYYSIQSQLCSFSSCAQVVNKIRLGLGWGEKVHPALQVNHRPIVGNQNTYNSHVSPPRYCDAEKISRKVSALKAAFKEAYAYKRVSSVILSFSSRSHERVRT